MNQDKDVGVSRVLFDGLQARHEILQIHNFRAAFDVEYINQHVDVSENRLFLVFKVVLHKLVLSATVSNGEAKVTEEPYFGLVDADCEAESHGVFGHVVGEDYASYRSFARFGGTH